MDGFMASDWVIHFDNTIQMAEKWKIEKIIFAVGVNDASFENGEKRCSQKKFQESLEILAQKGIGEVGARNVYFVGITDINFAIVNQEIEYFQKDRLSQFKQILFKTTQKNNCQFISLDNILSLEDLCFDGLHPNHSGHQKIYQKVKIALGA
jgi:lysophospholipase L1-like esterase